MKAKIYCYLYKQLCILQSNNCDNIRNILSQFTKLKSFKGCIHKNGITTNIYTYINNNEMFHFDFRKQFFKYVVSKKFQRNETNKRRGHFYTRFEVHKFYNFVSFINFINTGSSLEHKIFNLI